MKTLRSLYQQNKTRFQQAGIDDPALAARLLVKAACGVNDVDLISAPESVVTAAQSETLESHVKRHLAGEPISRILGESEFWGLPFKVTPDVLDPRPDTETLVEAALARFKDKPPERILDLGTGTGCIPIALLHEWPAAHAVAVDLSEKALAVARGNAEKNAVADRITFVQSDWFESVSGKFDLIVSNPPYIPNQDVPNLDVSVKNHDPILALAGGDDGLNPYRVIISHLKKHLNDGGRAFLEVGYSQADEVVRLSNDAGATQSRIYPDLAGIPRVVEISYGDK